MTAPPGADPSRGHIAPLPETKRQGAVGGRGASSLLGSPGSSKHMAAAAWDELGNCAATDVELVLPTGAEVLFVTPALAVLAAPRLCDAYNPRPCRPDRAPRPQPAAQDESESELPIAVDAVVHRHHCRRRPLRAPSTSLSRSPIQACAAWAPHDCFGALACSGGAFAMPRLQ